MANVIWIGNAEAIQQVDTLTVGGTIEADDVFNMTINGRVLSVVGGSTDADTVASTIVNAWNGLSDTYYPEFAEVTATSGSGTGEIVLRANTAGIPFTVTVETTEDGGGAADAQTFTRSATTANKSPNDVSDGDNWSGGSAPTGSDDVFIENSNVSLLYELDNFNAVAFSSLTVMSTFTGDIGLPERNANGYNEYRPTYFELAATTLVVGRGDGSGSRRVKFDFGSTQMTGTVQNTGTDKETGIPACLVKTTNSSSTLTVYNGRVGVAALSGETSTVDLTQRGGYVYLGKGVTLDDLEKTGGTLIAETVATQASKTLTLR